MDHLNLTNGMKKAAKSRESVKTYPLDCTHFMLKLACVPGIEYSDEFSGPVEIPVGNKIVYMTAYSGLINLNVLLAEIADPKNTNDQHGRVLNVLAAKFHNHVWRSFYRENKVGLSNHTLMDMYQAMPTTKTGYCKHVARCYIQVGCGPCEFR